MLRLARRADGADRRALRDRRVSRDGDRAEMEERHGVAVHRGDRERPAAMRCRAGERDDPARGRGDGRPGRGADVDAAVLAAGVRVASKLELL
jgi:hypothetical protein